MTAAVAEGNVPLASASPVAVPHAPPVRAGARVRVAATLRNHKIGAVAGWFVAQLVADLRGWWLLADQPGPLAHWFTTHAPVRVPADNRLLRAGWLAHNWTLGLAFAALSGLLFLAASGLRWLAHPVRAWTFLLIVAASVGVAVAYANLTPA
jgi:hypothetical protein